MLKDSFEKEQTLNNYTKSGSSELSISSKHRRFGKSSLKWSWNGEASFSTQKFAHLPQDKSPLKYGDHFPASPILVMSVYNEVAQNNKVKIAYIQDNKEQVWFQLPLNFTGWRTIWVPFYEMEGNPPKKTDTVAYDTFMVSTTTNTKGALFFDDIVFSQYQDDRHSYPDLIVPFIKWDKEVGSDHWMPLIRDIKRIENIQTSKVSDLEIKELALIEKRIDSKFFKKKNKLVDNLSDATTVFKGLKLDIKESVIGPPLTFNEQQVYFDKKDNFESKLITIKNFGKSLKKLAQYYHQSTDVNKQKVEKQFILATKYFLDQGWQKGSSGGTRHHIGYNVRELTDAFYMMKVSLKRSGLLNEVGSSLQWIFNIGKVLGPVEEFHSNIDYYNTQSFYHLMLIFMSDNVETKAALLKAYSNYISITLAQDKKEGVFKVDGTSWHHHGHYPAYGMGAFKTLPAVIHALSGTNFRISEAGHKNFKKAFLTTEKYSNLLDYGFGNAGRHPLDDNTIKSLKDQYLQMVYSGNPENTSKVDKDVAKAYLRLWGKRDKLNRTIFKDTYGITKESLPSYHVLPYAATAIHRHKTWAAFIKGYSKYVWASEIYVDENRYGRYPANGSIQLNNAGGNVKSGYKQEGWDWNRYPGTTVINLPFKELEPDTPLLMFKSAETFAGAVEMDGKGVFGMKLNESKGDNADGDEKVIGFPGKLKANKSIFSFGNKLICIGTGISSIDKENPTQTNIFQNYLTKTSKSISTFQETDIKRFPYNSSVSKKETSNKWLIDAYKNGYHILSDNNVEVRKQSQESYHNKYSIKTGKKNKKGKGVTVTKGDYASAWINHGLAPKGASYQYVIYPFLKNEELTSFSKFVKNDQSYEILRADDIAHIVKDVESKITGFVIFNANDLLNNNVISEVSAPSLLMVKEAKNKLLISVVEPDLNFKDARRGGYSYPVNLTITIKGEWRIKDESKIKSIAIVKNKTVVSLECRHGFSKKIELIKK